MVTNAKSPFRHLFLIIGIQTFILIFLIGISFQLSVPSQTLAQTRLPTPQVLGTNTYVVPSLKPLPTLTITPTPIIIKVIQPTPTTLPAILIASSVQTKSAKQSEYTVAVIGDSMIDTMGEFADYLEHRLKKVYPNTTFHMYNYGKGAQTVSDALSKIDSGFSHQTRNYPPLTSINPDIIITGSFAYNPYSPHDRGRHVSELTRMVEKLKSITPQVYLLAEIAPVRGEFGTGPQGVNWEEATNYVHSGNIIEQLENTYAVAQSQGITLIDLFSQTYNKETGAGNPAYVNPSDHIHPSVYGHEKTAEKMVSVIRLN